MRYKFFLLVLLVFTTGCGSLHKHTTGSVSIQVTGVGKTVEEAQKSGFRDAIQEAYGTLMLSERRIKNDSLFEDDVSYAKGVIENYTIISNSYHKNDRLFHLKMNVVVSPTSIQRRLLDAQDAQRVDGALLGKQIAIGKAQVASEVDRFLGARKLFEHMSANIGRSIFDVSVGQVKTVRNGQQISTTVDVSVQTNERSVENLCLATKEYHNARVNSIAGNYNVDLKDIWVNNVYKCNTNWIKIENEYFLAMRKSLLSVGFCMEIVDSSARVISRSFSKDWELVDDGWVPHSGFLPNKVKGFRCGGGEGCSYDPVGAVGVTHTYIKIKSGIWGDGKMTFPLQLPKLNHFTIKNISEIKVKIVVNEDCR